MRIAGKPAIFTMLAIIAGTEVAKQVTSTPTLLANGNFEVFYQLAVENKGEFDLRRVSSIYDLSGRFGPHVLKNVSGLAIDTRPSDPRSSIALNVSGWNGTTSTELVDQSVTSNLLASGDSFVVGFKVEIDALAAAGVLENIAKVSGTAVDVHGVQLFDTVGSLMTASDDTDSEVALSESTFSEPYGTDKKEDPIPDPAPVTSLRLTKTACDAVACGEKWDVTFIVSLENTGTVALESVEIFHDLAELFGAQFAGVRLNRITAGAGNTGTALMANAGFLTDTSTVMFKSKGRVDVGDAFEIVFVVTVDPTVDGTAVSGIESQINAICEAKDENGDRVTSLIRSTTPANDVCDDVVVTEGVNDRAKLAVAAAQNPTPVAIPGVAVVKSLIQSPLPMSNGNFKVVYELVIANTGNVGLADLTLVEDLKCYFSSVFVRAGNIAFVSSPSDASSRVILNRSWNGNGVIDLVDQTRPTLLAFGDSFAVRFAAEVNPTAVVFSGKTKSQVILSGERAEVAEPAQETVEEVLDVQGGDILAANVSDAQPEVSESQAAVSDSQADQSQTQFDPSSVSTSPALDEREANDDARPLNHPHLEITKTLKGELVHTARGNFVVTYQLFIENTGNVDLANLNLVEDVSSQFGRPFVKAGNLTITSDPSAAGSLVVVNSAAWNGKMSTELLDSSVANVIVSGDSFIIQFEVEVNPSHVTSSFEGLVSDSINVPATIYSGMPVDQRSDPATSVTGRLVPEGFYPSSGTLHKGTSATAAADIGSIMTLPLE